MIRLVNHSYANLHEITYQHLEWKVNIDFEKRKLHGTATYDIQINAQNQFPTHAILDTNHLIILSTAVDGENVPFELTHIDKVFGRALLIPIMTVSNRIQISYETTLLSMALQWLPKDQTASKMHPYLFTQCQAIHARTLLPCPDTPSCKFTYRATVTSPSWCTCLLSAVFENYAHEDSSRTSDTTTVVYSQTVPIPSYLIAIAAGRLESKELSPRSRVWAEPNVIHRAAHEFAQTAQFLQHAENITGQEYVWKRYDLVCLPPSFPYGGMENPCLTFVTPTLLAGDRSLADVVAHEIAHSWTGNLVTNHSWRDFWLNEGWTVWLERKIMTQIYSDNGMYDVKAMIGLRHLHDAIEGYGATHEYTCLVPDSDTVDPDDVFSSVPYEKGFNFLNYLSNVVGGRKEFEPFARAYIQRFRYKTVTSQEFKDFFIEYFTTVEDKTIAIQEIDWDAWYYSPGPLPIEPKFENYQAEQAIELGKSLYSSCEPSIWASLATSEAINVWPNVFHVLVLDTILTHMAEHSCGTFSAGHLDAIDKHMNAIYTKTNNAELRFRWYTIALRVRDKRIVPSVESFLQEQGRMKYIRPLYRDLAKCMGVKYATDCFIERKHMYHAIAAKMIAKDLAEMDHSAALCRLLEKDPEDLYAEEYASTLSDTTKGICNATSASAVTAIITSLLVALAVRSRIR